MIDARRDALVVAVDGPRQVRGRHADRRGQPCHRSGDMDLAQSDHRVDHRLDPVLMGLARDIHLLETAGRIRLGRLLRRVVEDGPDLSALRANQGLGDAIGGHLVEEAAAQVVDDDQPSGEVRIGHQREVRLEGAQAPVVPDYLRVSLLGQREDVASGDARIYLQPDGVKPVPGAERAGEIPSDQIAVALEPPGGQDGAGRRQLLSARGNPDDRTGVQNEARHAPAEDNGDVLPTAYLLLQNPHDLGATRRDVPARYQFVPGGKYVEDRYAKVGEPLDRRAGLTGQVFDQRGFKALAGQGHVVVEQVDVTVGDGTFPLEPRARAHYHPARRARPPAHRRVGLDEQDGRIPRRRLQRRGQARQPRTDHRHVEVAHGLSPYYNINHLAS